ncbi:MAG TPA: hypothetical protein VNC50_12545 [Planctomycetia bacterium]|nr:hypothetical protein [Planctomycetia bacterium]
MTRLRALVLWPFRRRRRAIPICLSVALCVWVAYFLRCRSELRAEKAALAAELRARGEIADFAELAGKVRADDPGLKHFLRALLSVGGESAAGYKAGATRSPLSEAVMIIGDWQPPADSPTVKDRDFLDKLSEPNPGPELALVAGRIAPAIAELERAVAHPPALLPHDYATTTPHAMLIPFEADVRMLAHGCKAAAFQAIVKGDARRAFAMANLCLRLGPRLERQPFLIARLIEIKAWEIGLETLAAVLGRFDPSPEEFKALDDSLLAAESFSYRAAVHGEQAMLLTLRERANFDELMQIVGARAQAEDRWRIKLKFWFERSGFGEVRRLQDDVRLMRNVERRIAAMDDLSPTGRAVLVDLALEPDRDLGAGLLGGAIADFGPFRAAKHRLLVKASLARGALRINRFRATHGRLPGALAEVADADWNPQSEILFGAAGPHYEKTNEGFLLRHADLSLIPKEGKANPYLIEVKNPPDRRPK